MKNEIRDRVLREQGRRDLQFDRQAVDVEARTVALSFASEEPYSRWWGVEILDCTASAVRLDRLRDGAALLLNHDRDQQIGVVESVRVGKDRVLRATVRLSRSALGDEILQDVVDGIRTKTSVGYMIHDLQLVSETDGISTYRATDWEPYELSIVSIPADVSVGIGRSLTQGSRNMNINEGSGRRARARLARERGSADLLLVPSQDRAAFLRHLQDEADEADTTVEALRSEIPLVDLYQDWRALTIRGLLEPYEHRLPPGTIDGYTAREDVTVRAATKEVLQMLERQMQPTQTGRVEPGFENRDTYGSGARTLSHFDGARGEREHKQRVAHAAGRWVRGSLFGSTADQRWVREHLGEQQRALGGGVYASGGALVPEQVAAEVIVQAEQYGIARMRARIWPMASGSLAVPREITAPTAAFTPENTTITTVDPTFGAITLTAKTLSSLVLVSRALVEDSAPEIIGGYLMEALARRTAETEDACCFVADGTSTYGGMQGLTHLLESGNFNGSRHVGLSDDDTFGEVELSDVLSMIAAAPEWAKSAPDAALYMSAGFRDAVLLRLASAAGGNSVTSMQDGLQRWAGYPIVTVACMPSSASTDYSGDVVALFGSMRRTVHMGDRRSLELMVDQSFGFDKDQIALRSTTRFDIVSDLPQSSSVAGGMVGLQLNPA